MKPFLIVLSHLPPRSDLATLFFFFFSFLPPPPPTPHTVFLTWKLLQCCIHGWLLLISYILINILPTETFPDEPTESTSFVTDFHFMTLYCFRAENIIWIKFFWGGPGLLAWRHSVKSANIIEKQYDLINNKHKWVNRWIIRTEQKK